VVFETGLTDWSLDRTVDNRTDSVTIGQSQVRFGIADHGEVAVGWTPFARHYSLDRATGQIDRQSGIGDISLALKRSFGRADAPRIAILATVTLPVGKPPSGAGDWGAAVQLPVALSLSDKLQVSLTPEIDATPNASGSGHHIAYGGAMGLGLTLAKALAVGADVRMVRDDDPSGGATKATAGLSFALQCGANTQFDLGGNFGLNAVSPDVEIYIGFARRF
jgi:hypothetical protein